jgi:hypothetical protein
MQRIFITGASSGLGAGLARHYAKPGATLGLVARREALLADLAGELRARGATVHLLPADVTDLPAMRAATERFLADAGGVDLVVANAGVGIRSALHEGNAEEVARLMQINVIGVTNNIVPFVPTMIEQRAGVLCAIASMAGHRAMPGRVAYSASKKAVITFMDGLRMDLHGSGAHAMTICPGFVRTPLTDGMPAMMSGGSPGIVIDPVIGPRSPLGLTMLLGAVEAWQDRRRLDRDYGCVVQCEPDERGERLRPSRHARCPGNAPNSAPQTQTSSRLSSQT